MLAKLKETIEENYKKQRKQIIEKNKLFLEKYPKKIEEETENLDLQTKKVASIQEIERMPKYRFYTHLDEQLPTKDDPVLRFIPYIPNDATHYELFMYEGVELGEKPFNKEMHLNESMLKEILKKYSDIKLFHLKKLLGNKEIEYKTIKREYLDLLEFSMYSKMPWSKILNFWENTFDKKRVCLFSDPDSLDYYFCNVCYTFDCWTHENLTNLSLKIKKKTISFLENEEIHIKMCVDSEESNNEIELERILNTYTKEYDFINNNYDVDPCTAALFFNFCTKEKLPNHIFPKCKETFLIKKDTQLFTKRKGDLTFYFPCQHIGNCTNNPDCTCDQNKINCEEFCLCLECDNLFEGCECKDCSTKCKCFTLKRECSFTCNCTNCNNKIFTLKKYKKTYIGKSAISNFGLFAGEFIEKDSFICEYSGELISNSEAERRGNFYEKRQCSYLFDVSNLNKISHHTLDAIYVGNNSRFANHSIKPNIQAKNFLVNGIRRIGFFALFDIRKHTELFFDYNYKVERKIAHGIIE